MPSSVPVLEMTRVTWVAVAVLAVSTVLGVGLPSTAWGQLATPIACELPAPEVLLSLREVWVTNGVYTGVVRAANLVRFTGRQ